MIAVKKRPRKVQISLRLDRDVVEYFRSTGKGWQSRMHEVLRAYREYQRRRDAR